MNTSTYATTNTFIYVIALLLLVLIIIYFYNEYKNITDSSDSSTNNTDKYYSPCPDYWNNIGENQCQNINKLGSCSKNTNNMIMDFNDKIFTNKLNGNYAKCKWAKGCGVSWENIDKLC